MFQVTVQIQLNIALQLRKQKPETEASRVIEQTVERFGAGLEPVHPNSNDPLLVPFFVVPVTDRQTAEQIMIDLRTCPGIEATYLKPMDELP